MEINLQELFNFTDADLKENRKGRLSNAQINRLEQEKSENTDSLVILLFISVVFFITLWAFFPEIFRIRIIIVVVAVFTGLIIIRYVNNWNMSRKPETMLKDSELNSVEGNLHLEHTVREIPIGTVSRISFKVNDKPIDRVHFNNLAKWAKLGLQEKD